MTRLLRSLDVKPEVYYLGFARMADSFGTSILIILIPLYVEHYGISFQGASAPVTIGLLLSVFGVVNSLSQPSVGVFLDRFQTRKLFLTTGLAIYATSTILFIWLTNFEGLVILRIFQGVGVALTVPPSLTLITEHTEPIRRGTAMSLYNIMRLIGFAVGPLVGGYLLPVLGFSGLLIMAGLGGWISVCLVQFLVEDVELTASQSEFVGYRESYAAFFSSDMIDFFKLAYANMAMAMSISLIAALENEFNSRLNQTPGDFALGFSALIISLILFQLPIGRASDQYGRKICIVFGLFFLTPVTFWMGYVQTTWQFILARILQGISVAAIAAPSFALGGDKSQSTRRGREMSLLSMAFGLGIGIGPFIAGTMAGFFSFESPFWVGSFLSLLGGFTVAFFVSEEDLSKKRT